jgi:hypothetical protein
MALLVHLLTRSFQPLHRITIEKINGRDAAFSPYLGVLREYFDVEADFRQVIVYRSLHS